MIGSVLEQAQKFLGRGFLISAFIPSLLFSAVFLYLAEGEQTLRSTVQDVMEKGFQQAGFEIVKLLVAIYLLAYVVYGIRGALHNWYQGNWPDVMHPLRAWGLQRNRKIMRRRRSRVEAATSRLNVADWVAARGFKTTYFPIKLSSEEAEERLSTARNTHVALVTGLNDRPEWDDKDDQLYWHVLTEACLLQANGKGLAPHLQVRIAQLVKEIKEAYGTKANVRLRGSAQAFKADAEGEWAKARDDLANEFPGNERFLRPTRLGNITMVQELYPLDRYGITLSGLWPRLMHVMPADARDRLEDANIFLDFTVIMSLLSAVASAIAVVTLVEESNRSLFPRGFLILIFVLSTWLFYGLSIQASAGIKHQVAAAVDLFRLNLLDSLGIERPSTPKEEFEIWKELRFFFAQADTPQDHVRFSGTGTVHSVNAGSSTSAEPSQ